MSQTEVKSDVGFATLHREDTLRRVIRRIAVSLELAEVSHRIDLSGVPDGEHWEELAFRTGCRQLGIFTATVKDANLNVVLDVLHDGHVIIIPQSTGDYLLLERQVGRKIEFTSVNGRMTHGTLSKRAVKRVLSDDAELVIAKRELECDSLSSHGDEHDGHHLSPLRRFFQLLRLESDDIWTVILFAFVSGILALATPLAVESLVNVVSWGTYLQPLLVLSLILLASLGLAGGLKVLQSVIVEIIQRRQLVRIVGDLAHRFPRAQRPYLEAHYPRELANRVFDIMTIQKATATLLLDGVSIALSTTMGMILLSFYHPYLLGFNVVLLITMITIIRFLGRGGISTSIDESIAKYRIAHWLQDVISFPSTFKVNGGEPLAIERANSFAAEYLLARESQFRVVLRQMVFAIGLQVISSTIVLGLGGWLVIVRQLTLGQLVASELVVTVVVGAFAKAGKSLEKFYDLMAGIDKVGHLLDLPVDYRRGRISLTDKPLTVKWKDLHLVNGPNQRQFRAGELPPGDATAFHTEDTTAAELLFNAFTGLAGPRSGAIEVAGMAPNEAAFAGMGRLVTVAKDVELFHATLAENVELGRSGIGLDQVREALRTVGLEDTIRELPDGIDTQLQTGGAPLAREQQIRLMLARAIVGQPKFLLLGHIIDELPAAQRVEIFAAIRSGVKRCTILVATRDAAIADACDHRLKSIVAH